MHDAAGHWALGTGHWALGTGHWGYNMMVVMLWWVPQQCILQVVDCLIREQDAEGSAVSYKYTCEVRVFVTLHE